MKKILAMLLAFSLVFAFTACGDDTSVEVNSLKPTEAFNTYVSNVYTEVGYSMDFSYEYDGVKKDVKYSAIKPADSAKVQFKYETAAQKAAFVSETIEGAKISLFYHDDGSKKVASEIPADKIASAAELKPFLLSNAVVVSGILDEVTMNLESEGNMTFTGTGAKIADFDKIFPEFAEYEALKDDVAALEFVYTVKEAVLDNVTIKGMINGKEFSAYASNFEVISDAKTSLKFEDSDSYAKKITSDLDELAAKQEAEAEAAAEAATSEGAAETAAE